MNKIKIDNSRKVTDFDYLKTLSKGNVQFEEEMIKIFLAEIPKEIKLMEQGIDENNFALVKSLVHSMRGTIRFIGLDKIIKTELTEIEKLATAQENILEIGMLFQKVKKIYQKTIDELNESALLFIPDVTEKV